jgi:dihydroxyacetone kinase-like protein
MDMVGKPEILPDVIALLHGTISNNADELEELDRILGDGDHVVNLLRGLGVLQAKSEDLVRTDWSGAFQVIGLSLMSSVGGASGSLYGTLFLKMGSVLKESELTTSGMADAFSQGVDAMKARGKSDVGEKTMLDVLVPVAQCLTRLSDEGAGRNALLEAMANVALEGVEATRNMVATKGRAAYLGERSVGHVDADAKSSQVMLCALTDFLVDEA